MKKRCDGFIFFMTLCTILVISVLLITCMQHVLLYHKAINMQEKTHQSFFQLEYLATRLVTSSRVLNDKNCIHYGDSANQVLHQLMLNNKGCLWSIGKTKYRYIIEDLGDFPCLKLKNQRKLASHHVRISIVLLTDDGNTASALQVRIIKSAGPADCIGKEHQVKSGISSWRYFSALK